MSRLTEREREEIRRVKRAVEKEAREEFSQVHLANNVDTRHSAPGLAAQLALLSGLAEIAWILRNEVVLPVRHWIQARRATAELQRLDDRILKDIGVERCQIDSRIAEHKIHAAKTPRPETGAIAALRHWISRRRTVDTLSALDDRMLEDIGLVRANLSDFVRKLDKAVVEGRLEGQTAAQTLRGRTAAQAKEAADMSREAADDMARLDPEALAKIGYVKARLSTDGTRMLAGHKLSAA